MSNALPAEQTASCYGFCANWLVGYHEDAALVRGGFNRKRTIGGPNKPDPPAAEYAHRAR